MPFDIENHSPFPALAFIKRAPGDEELHVFAARATFDWAHGGEMTISEEQMPLVLADEHRGEPEEGDLIWETDLVPGKPRTDVHVTGHARAPGGEPAASFVASVRVGKLEKAVRVTGPRRWERSLLFGFRLSPPEPVASVLLSYTLAFGGTRRRGSEEDAFDRNPIGVGYLGRFPAPDSMFAAPQLEDLNHPIRSLSEETLPQGFGPIARWWTPRRQRAGTLTEAGVLENPGQLPEDFDWSFYQSAHPDLVYPGYLQGDEIVETTGLFTEGVSVSRLPGYRPIAVAVLPSGRPLSLLPKLDTLTIDSDARKVHATFRLTLPAALETSLLVFGMASPGGKGSGSPPLVSLRRSA